MSERHAPEELNELEVALCGLTPAASAIDRDRLMFEMGRASVATAHVVASAHAPRTELRLWRSAAAILAVISLGLGWQVTRPRPAQIVYLPASSNEEVSPLDSASSPSNPVPQIDATPSTIKHMAPRGEILRPRFSQLPSVSSWGGTLAAGSSWTAVSQSDWSDMRDARRPTDAAPEQAPPRVQDHRRWSEQFDEPNEKKPANENPTTIIPTNPQKGAA